jgi:hypothetical protein
MSVKLSPIETVCGGDGEVNGGSRRGEQNGVCSSNASVR